uniref:Uncharacterized protein n=1 Tax=Candidatus Kentrum sp. FW TaxID=2126338 RepID=A0A450SYS3_9GAMM|nr:MAG: Protein of unknown function (DUF3375) [Candidatus Kentron sp. FW]
MASWLGDGYLERRFSPGASEEEYELSTAAVEAIRFLSAIAQPRSTVTESRLSLVIQALAKLAEDTDTDKSRRIERLLAEKTRIDSVSELIARSEIDFGALKDNVRATLEQRSQASIADVLDRFPAAQGLGSVVGLLALGSRHGLEGNGIEMVACVGEDNQRRRRAFRKSISCGSEWMSWSDDLYPVRSGSKRLSRNLCRG